MLQRTFYPITPLQFSGPPIGLDLLRDSWHRSLKGIRSYHGGPRFFPVLCRGLNILDVTSNIERTSNLFCNL